jgi:hypothetical protein
LQDYEEISSTQYIKLSLFSAAFAFSIFIRNLHYFYNAMMALKLKKLFMNAIYDKLGKLSLDSMGEVNDGKLISIL